jgi:hypothetical protein
MVFMIFFFITGIFSILFIYEYIIFHSGSGYAFIPSGSGSGYVPSLHQFYGNVYEPNGSVAIEEYLIEAKYNGSVVSSAFVLDGKYGYTPVFVVEDLNDGDEIEFYLDSLKFDEIEFENFRFTELNLRYSDICGDGYCASEIDVNCVSSTFNESR